LGIIHATAAHRELSGNELLKSPAYMLMARPHCLQLLAQRAFCAEALALAKAGNSRPARMAMIAMTTSSSIRVNAQFCPLRLLPLHSSARYTVKFEFMHDFPTRRASWISALQEPAPDW